MTKDYKKPSAEKQFEIYVAQPVGAIQPKKRYELYWKVFEVRTV